MAVARLPSQEVDLRRMAWAALALVLVVVGLAVVQVVRPVPAPAAVIDAAAAERQPAGATVAWPAARESAVVISGLGPVWVRGAQRPVPIASVAKMMTAYVALRDHPLRPGEAGPRLVISAAEAAALKPDLARSESVVKVRAGEVLTERQALEALLLPSADNIADVLARWDAGSVPAFLSRMNVQARRLGMRHTRYTDPSGLAATTVSTARDQLTLARRAMRVPAFAAIVAMPAVTLPVAGTVENYDYDIGHGGVTGIKTGSDSAALGCWAFAVSRQAAGARHTIYGVVLGVPATRQGLVEPALAAGTGLADQLTASVRRTIVLPAGSVVGRVRLPWSTAAVPIVTTRAVAGLVSAGLGVTWHARLRKLTGRPLRRGEPVGTLTTPDVVGVSSTALTTADSAPGPPITWRMTRP